MLAIGINKVAQICRFVWRRECLSRGCGWGVFPGPLRAIVQVAHLTRRWRIFSKPVIHLFVKPSLETSEAHEL